MRVLPAVLTEPVIDHLVMLYFDIVNIHTDWGGVATRTTSILLQEMRAHDVPDVIEVLQKGRLVGVQTPTRVNLTEPPCDARYDVLGADATTCAARGLDVFALDATKLLRPGVIKVALRPIICCHALAFGCLGCVVA